MLLPLWLLAAGPTLWYQLLTAHFRPLTAVERVGMSIPLGFTTQAWLAALLGSYRGMLDGLVLFFTALNLTAVAAYAARRHSVRFAAALAGELRRNVNQAVALGLAVLPALFLTACFATGALTELDTGEVFVTAGMEKDLPFHLTLINAFLNGEASGPFWVFRVASPFVSGHHVSYAFTADLHAATLVRAGLGLKSTLVLTFFAQAMAAAMLLFSASQRFFGPQRHWSATMVVALVFFAGGDFSFEAAPSYWIYWARDMFMPERSTQYAFSMALASVVFVWTGMSLSPTASYHEIGPLLKSKDADKQRERQRDPSLIYRIRDQLYVMGGICCGLLLCLQPQAFVGVLIAAGLAIALDTPVWLWEVDNIASVCYFGCTACFVALPFFPMYLPGLAHCPRGQCTIYDYPLARPVWAGDGLFSWLWSNGSVYLPLALAAFAQLNERQRKQFGGFCASLALALVVQFQPWAEDNMRIVYLWYAVSVMALIAALDTLYAEFERTELLVALVVVMLALPGYMAAFHDSADFRVLYTHDDKAVADWALENTARDAIFVIHSTPAHPLTTIAGRTAYIAYEDWVFGDVTAREQDVINIVTGKGKAMEVVASNKISYVVVPKGEKIGSSVPDEGFLADNMDRVFHNDKYNVYEYRGRRG